MKIKKIRPDSTEPKIAKPGDAAFDMYADVDGDIYPGEQWKVSLGVQIEVPENHVALLVPRSSTGSLGMHLANVIGVIDSSYRGAVIANIKNNSGDPLRINRGDRVCQMLIVPCVTPALEVVEELSSTERGAGGFGSTGQ